MKLAAIQSAIRSILFIYVIHSSTALSHEPKADVSTVPDPTVNCRETERTTLRLHLRFLSVTPSFVPHLEPAELIQDGLGKEFPSDVKLPPRSPEEVASFVSSPVRALDINGDGRSDLVIGSRDGLMARIGIAEPGGRFRLTSSIRFEQPMDFVQAVVLGRGDHGRARLLLPPLRAGDYFRLFEVSDLATGAPGTVFSQPRGFDDMLLKVVPDLEGSEYTVREIDESGSSEIRWHTASSPPFPPMRLDADPRNERFLGLGHIPFSSQQVGFLALFEEAKLRLEVFAPDWLLAYGRHVFDSGLIAAVAGDFNGDGSTDILWLPRGNRMRGASIELSLPDTPLSVPLPGVAEAIGSRSILAAGDFDASGTDSLLLGGQNDIALLHLGAGSIPRDRLRISVDGEDRKSAWDGTMTLEIPVGTTKRISFGGKGVRTRPESIAITADSPGSRSIGVFVELDSEADDGRVVELGFHPEGPFVCNGFNPGYKGEGFEEWGRMLSCASGMVAFESDDGLSLSCCRVPSDMLISGRDVYRESACPDGFVVTGLTDNEAIRKEHCGSCRFLLRCTAVDTARYRLLERTEGQFWGEGSNLRYGVRNIGRLDFPAAVREGFGRTGPTSWDTSGCIGQTWGSMLVARSGKDCRKYLFSAVVRVADASASSSDWKPIRECSTAPESTNPTAGCVPAR